MKIFDASQIKEIDAYTIAHEPINSIDLMERAARKCAEWIRPRVRSAPGVHVFCGPGNNGGDGLAIGRMLAGTGSKVTVYKIRYAGNTSHDFAINEKRLDGVKNLHSVDLYDGDTFPEIRATDVIIDAIFGNGLSRPVEGFVAGLVAQMNASGAVIMAIDLPSGLFGEDNRNNAMNAVVKADYTLTFQFPKLSFMLASNQEYVGTWYVLDIGLHPDAIISSATSNFYLEAADIQSLYHRRHKFAHKGHFGHALVLSGSKGKMGAAVLSARACLRSGAGLLSMAVPACGYEIVQSGLPEAMCICDEQDDWISQIPALQPYNAIGIGPGIGMHADTQRALKKLIQDAHCPLVLDADALNILAENPTWFDFLPAYSILTPHPKEFERMTGKAGCDYERLLRGKEFSRRYNTILLLKGAHTVVIAPDGTCYFNSTGNPGMATGGSGDVLTGMITGWMAQQYTPLQSALLAVYLHGAAGDLAAAGKAHEGLIAGDIVEMIPKAIKKTFRSI